MAPTDRQIRAAAEALQASIESQRGINSQSIHSINSISRATDIILSEHLIAGARYNGKMSNVRRFFCLFVTFDLLFTCLLWLICSTIAGESAESAFVDQVVHYNISTSLFDIVMVAICRFTVLLLFYALLYINHWFIVALSTALSCAFLLAKVFLFDWSRNSQPVFQVLLIIMSFVLAWGEAWFLDIRVIPQEAEARNWILGSVETERAPLLEPGAPSNLYSENVGTFYTPVDSSDLSEDGGEEDLKRFETDSPFRPITVNLSEQKKNEYKNKGKLLLNRSCELLTSKVWIVDKTTPGGDVISYMPLPKTGKKILRISGTVNTSAKALADNLFENVETSLKWNKQLSECKKINTIDENTDIIYQTTPTFGNGIVTARDFVTLRHRGNIGPYFVSCGISISCAEYPNRKNFIRGDTELGCFATEDNGENSCRFTYILNADLKIPWLPQKMIDNLSVTALAEFMDLLRNHSRNLKS